MCIAYYVPTLGISKIEEWPITELYIKQLNYIKSITLSSHYIALNINFSTGYDQSVKTPWLIYWLIDLGSHVSINPSFGAPKHPALFTWAKDLKT